MVKPKHKTIAVDSDSWIVVKKQRVNILIPSLPGSEPCTTLNNGNPEIPSEKPLEAHIKDTNDVFNNGNPKIPCEKPLEAHIEDTNDVLITSLPPKTNTQNLQQSPPNYATPIVKLRKSPSRNPMNNDRVEASIPLHRNATSVMKLLETPNTHNSGTPSQKLGVYGACTSPSSTTVLNKMMRAANLERKIARAGGMSRWLSSLRLEQFVMVFQAKKVSKFQLANLSMQKLKEMGVHAVGPRRKLIHAIECLCEPCCLQGV